MRTRSKDKKKYESKDKEDNAKQLEQIMEEENDDSSEIRERNKKFVEKIDLKAREKIEGPLPDENVGYFLEQLGNLIGQDYYNAPPEGKETKVKDLNELLTKKVSRKKDASMPQKILNAAAKSRVDSKEKLLSVMKDKKLNVALTDAQKDLFVEILKARSYNKLINVGDVLKGKSLYVKHMLHTMEDDTLENMVSFVTNDRLYLLCLLMYTIDLTSDKNKDQPAVELSFKPKRVSIQSIGINYKKGEKIKNGFLQDYVDYATSIGESWLNETSRDIYIGFKDYVDAKLKNPEDENVKKYEKECEDNNIDINTFMHNNLRYYFLLKDDDNTEGNEAILCIPEDFNTTIEDYINTQKFVAKDKKLYKEGIKTFDLKSQSTVYISSELKVVDYMPNVIKFDKFMSTAYILTSEVDLNEYSAACWEYDKKIYNKKDEEVPPNPYFYPNICSFDTFDTFMNYILVHILTHAYPKAIVDRYIDSYTYYIENRQIFLKISKCLHSIQKFLVRFFCSFRTKVNFDVCTSLYTIGKKILEEFQVLYDLNIYKYYVQFIRTYLPATKIMYNAASDESNIIPVFNGCMQVLAQLIKFDRNGLVDKFRTCAVAIFRMFLGVGNPREEINDYITPSSFLGNMTGDFSKTVIQQNLDVFFNQETNRTVDSDLRAERINYFMEQEYNNMSDAIEKGFASYVDQGAKGFDYDVLYTLFDFFMKLIEKPENKEYYDKIRNVVLSYFIETGDVPYYQDEVMRKALVAYMIPLLKEEQKDGDDKIELYNKGVEVTVGDIDPDEIQNIIDSQLRRKKNIEVRKKGLILSNRKKKKGILTDIRKERDEIVEKIRKELLQRKREREAEELRKKKPKGTAKKLINQMKNLQENIDELKDNLEENQIQNKILKKKIVKAAKKDKENMSAISGESQQSIASNVKTDKRTAVKSLKPGTYSEAGKTKKKKYKSNSPQPKTKKKKDQSSSDEEDDKEF